jgi:predicted DNA-binding protein
MPLEIRELVIRVAVNENNQSANQDFDFLEKKLQETKNIIVKECIEKVMSEI